MPLATNTGGLSVEGGEVEPPCEFVVDAVEVPVELDGLE